MAFLRHAAAVAWKDLRVELRTREILSTMVFFAVMIVIVCSFAFVEKELTAPADTAFQIRFDNQDPGTPHDVDIRGQDGAAVDDNEITTGVTQTTYDVPALPAGSYTCALTGASVTGGTVRISDIFSTYPVALLVQEDAA